MGHHGLVGREGGHSIALPYQRPQGFVKGLLMAMGSLKVEHREPIYAKQQRPSTHHVSPKVNQVSPTPLAQGNVGEHLPLCSTTPTIPQAPGPCASSPSQHLRGPMRSNPATHKHHAKVVLTPVNPVAERQAVPCAKHKEGGSSRSKGHWHKAGCLGFPTIPPWGPAASSTKCHKNGLLRWAPLLHPNMGGPGTGRPGPFNAPGQCQLHGTTIPCNSPCHQQLCWGI